MIMNVFQKSLQLDLKCVKLDLKCLELDLKCVEFNIPEPYSSLHLTPVQESDL